MILPFDPTTTTTGSSGAGFIISAACAGAASIIGSIALIGRRKQQADPENSTVRLRERLTALETNVSDLRTRHSDLEEEVRLYRAVQVSDEQRRRR